MNPGEGVYQDQSIGTQNGKISWTRALAIQGKRPFTVKELLIANITIIGIDIIQAEALN
jgi:hypothetical protein